MSSAASHSPDFSKSPADPPAESASLKTPPKRPALVSPPQRPSKPASRDREKAAEPQTPPVAAPAPAPFNAAVPAAEVDSEANRYQPIAPPSEPMQYRAIGLIRGTYAPEDEQFNRGTLTTEEGVTIEAVLLGRVTSLVKKHLDLESSHLWVVYPRTRKADKADDDDEDQDLHVQIVGVWEPETLGLPGEGVDSEAEEEGETEAESGADPAAEAAAAPEAVEAPAGADEKPKISLEDLPPVDENYFSIRGEIVRYEEDQQIIIVKILQGLKRPPASRKAFRLLVQGRLEGRTIGYFWDLNVKREARTLVLETGAAVGIVPPKKRKGGAPGGRRGGPPRRGGPGGGKRPFTPRPASKGPRPAPPSKPSEGSPIPKPRTVD